MIEGAAFSRALTRAGETIMMSQMNLVQNAARLAMDHRAASPLRRKRQPSSGSGRGSMAVAGIAAALLLVALAVLVL